MKTEVISVKVSVSLKCSRFAVLIGTNGNHDKTWEEAPKIIRDLIEKGQIKIKLGSLEIPKELINYIQIESDDSFEVDSENSPKIHKELQEKNYYVDKFKE